MTNEELEKKWREDYRKLLEIEFGTCFTAKDVNDYWYKGLKGYLAGRKKGEEELKHWNEVHGRIVAGINEEKKTIVANMRNDIESLKKELDREVKKLNLKHAMDLRSTYENSAKRPSETGVALLIQGHDFKLVEDRYKHEIESLKKELDSSRRLFANLFYKNKKMRDLIERAKPYMLAYCRLVDCDLDDVHEFIEEAELILNGRGL